MHESTSPHPLESAIDWEHIYPKLSRHLVRQILQDVIKESNKRPDYYDHEASLRLFHRRCAKEMYAFTQNELHLRSFSEARDMKIKYPYVPSREIFSMLRESACESRKRSDQHNADAMLSIAEKRIGMRNVDLKDMSEEYRVEGAYDADDEKMKDYSELAVFVHILLRDTIRNPFLWGDLSVATCCNLWRLAILAQGPKALEGTFQVPTAAMELFFATIIFLVVRNSVQNANERVMKHRKNSLV